MSEQHLTIKRQLTLNRVRRSFLKMPIMKDLNMVGILASTSMRAENALVEAGFDISDQPMISNFNACNIRNVRTQKNSLETTSRKVETANESHIGGVRRPSQVQFNQTTSSAFPSAKSQLKQQCAGHKSAEILRSRPKTSQGNNCVVQGSAPVVGNRYNPSKKYSVVEKRFKKAKNLKDPGSGSFTLNQNLSRVTVSRGGGGQNQSSTQTGRTRTKSDNLILLNSDASAELINCNGDLVLKSGDQSRKITSRQEHQRSVERLNLMNPSHETSQHQLVPNTERQSAVNSSHSQNLLRRVAVGAGGGHDQESASGGGGVYANMRNPNAAANAESFRAYTVPSTVNDLKTHQENDFSSYMAGTTVAKKTDASRRSAFGKKNRQRQFKSTHERTHFTKHSTQDDSRLESYVSARQIPVHSLENRKQLQEKLDVQDSGVVDAKRILQMLQQSTERPPAYYVYNKPVTLINAPTKEADKKMLGGRPSARKAEAAYENRSMSAFGSQRKRRQSNHDSIKTISFSQYAQSEKKSICSHDQHASLNSPNYMNPNATTVVLNTNDQRANKIFQNSGFTVKGVVQAQTHGTKKVNFQAEMKQLQKDHKEFMRDFQEDEIRDNNEYLEAKLTMIRVTGEPRPKQNPHKVDVIKKQDQRQQSNMASRQSRQSSAGNYSQRSVSRAHSKTHDQYMDLMRYLEKYKDFICYESNGVIPKQKGRFGEEDPLVRENELQTEDIWPVEKNGKNKGKIIPRKDVRGNIVVDPVGNIVKENYLLDYNIYEVLSSMKRQRSSGDNAQQMDEQVLHKIQNFTEAEKKRIKELFEFQQREPLYRKGPPMTDGRIKPYENNGSIARKYIKNKRSGMMAGCKDVDQIGDYDRQSTNLLNDIPKFTPTNCGFFKQVVSRKEQTAIANKDRSKKERITSDRVNPIYDKKNYRTFISSKRDQSLVQEYQKAAADKILDDLHSSSKKLVYAGDVEKSSKKQIAETKKIIKEMSQTNEKWADLVYADPRTQHIVHAQHSDDAQSIKSILKQGSSGSASQQHQQLIFSSFELPYDDINVKVLSSDQVETFPANEVIMENNIDSAEETISYHSDGMSDHSDRTQKPSHALQQLREEQRQADSEMVAREERGAAAIQDQARKPVDRRCRRKPSNPKRSFDKNQVTNKLNQSLMQLYQTCREEQDKVNECGDQLNLLSKMLIDDQGSIDLSYKHAKNILNSSVLTANYDTMQARQKQRQLRAASVKI